MGIKPTMYLVVGVADVVENDTRNTSKKDVYNTPLEYWVSKDGYFSDKRYHDKNVPGYTAEVKDIVTHLYFEGDNPGKVLTIDYDMNEYIEYCLKNELLFEKE